MKAHYHKLTRLFRMANNKSVFHISIKIVQFALRKNHLIDELSISVGCSAPSLGFVFNYDVELQTVRACATVPVYER